MNLWGQGAAHDHVKRCGDDRHFLGFFRHPAGIPSLQVGHRRFILELEQRHRAVRAWRVRGGEREHLDNRLRRSRHLDQVVQLLASPPARPRTAAAPPRRSPPTASADCRGRGSPGAPAWPARSAPERPAGHRGGTRGSPPAHTPWSAAAPESRAVPSQRSPTRGPHAPRAARTTPDKARQSCPGKSARTRRASRTAHRIARRTHAAASAHTPQPSDTATWTPSAAARLPAA